MSPRKPAILREGDGQNLREYLIATAARLIDERGGAGLSVRDIAREAQVADGVLYNYFEDKEDLLAHALLAHVGTVMNSAPRLPPAGTGTVAENLRLFIDAGLATLTRVVPAFAGLISQPNVLKRFRAMVGGDAAFAGEAATGGGQKAAGDGVAQGGETGGGVAEGKAGPGRTGPPDGRDGDGQAGLPAIMAAYLRAEQRLGRIDKGRRHRRRRDPGRRRHPRPDPAEGPFQPAGQPGHRPPELAGRRAATVLSGIAPVSSRP
jgi:AcrR family transcriptional regulator